MFSERSLHSAFIHKLYEFIYDNLNEYVYVNYVAVNETSPQGGKSELICGDLSAPNKYVYDNYIYVVGEKMYWIRSEPT